MDEEQIPQQVNPMPGFGDDLREVRLGRKLTQEHVAKGTGFSRTYVTKVETGAVFPSENFAQKCDVVFNTHGMFERLRSRLEDLGHAAWFAPYLDLEDKASRILGFSSSLIWGLLQTPDYAQAIFKAANPKADDETIESKVLARMARRRVFERKDPPEVWAVFHEACLRTVVGTKKVMAEQVEYLLDFMNRPYVNAQVLPFSAGAPDGMFHPFTLLAFEGGVPSLVYADGRYEGKIYDAPKTVGSAISFYDRLRLRSLSTDKSVAFMNSLIKEYRS
ncbi:helix-turn-helix transcriptional regulator [Streptomyces sp. RFCAC02]|uniref:helix-turn-helix domain-containing protein n=1 Tax=Streptomyces sp. RFCAC02 TaxID=2499143 RepID=UPI001F0FD622|nr:helix-turn-helix transcriptional regulator [Streptomyces sp. RFCAC02]